MAEDDIHLLGFGVDTAGLLAGQDAAGKLAQSLHNVADASDKEAAAAARASTEERKRAEAAQAAATAALRAAEAERQKLEEIRKATEANLREAEALQKSASADRVKAEAAAISEAAIQANAAAVIASIKALRDQEEATKRAEREERKRAEAARKAAEEARRAAEEAERARNPYHRLSDSLARVSEHSNILSGGLASATQSITMLSASVGQGGASGVTGAISMLSSGVGRLGALMGGVAGGALGVAAAFTAVAAASAGLLMVTAPAQEQFMLLEARLKNVYGSGAVAADTFEQITALAQRNGMAIEQTAESYLRLARNNEAIGMTIGQTVELTDAVQKLGRVSGASQGEISGAMLQFSQALAAGRLNGDELRSIMENMPALAKSIADGLGVSVGQLRAMGAEGELTSAKVVGALRSQIDEINKEFQGLPDTTEQAFTRIGNAWSKLIATMGEELNASEILVGFLNWSAGVIDGAAEGIKPETPEEKFRRLSELKANGGFPADLFVGGPGGYMIPQEVKQQELDRQLQEVKDELEAKEKNRLQARLDAERMADRAPFVSALPVMQDVDKVGSQTKGITENIRQLEAALKTAREKPLRFIEDADLEKVQKLPGLIAALRTQLEGAKGATALYREETAKMASDLATYGAAGMGIGAEARGLVKSDAAKGIDTTEAEALDAVMERRTQKVREQTEAMDAQIAEQQRMADAVGQGAAAQREAEIATKALTLQLQTFGTTLDDDARAAMDGYIEKLRELLKAQDDAAASAKLYNEQVTAGINAQIEAAIRAGATSGELAELRRSLQFGQEFQKVAGGPAASVSLAGGATIPADYQAYFDRAAAASGIPASVLAAVAKVESGFKPDAVSETGATGIMQILPSTAKDPGYGVTPLSSDQLTNPELNIMFGAQYLRGRAQSMGLDNLNDPQQLRKLLRAYSGADTETGDKAYDDKVIGALGLPAQAVAAQAGNAADAATQQALQRLAEIERERRNADERANAPDTAARRQVEIEQQAKEAASAYTGPEAERIYAERKAALIEQDRQAADDRMKAYDRETAKLDQQLKAAGLVGRAREVELEVIKRINEEEAKGVAVTAEKEAQIRAQVEARLERQDVVDRTEEQADRYVRVWESAADAIGGALDSAIRTAAEGGTVKAGELLTGLVADITSAIASAYITQPLVSGIKEWIGSAHGNVFSDGNLVPYALGGVVTKPTLFPLAHGAGLMGEAGAEAILPLKRGPDGRLGVGGGSGGGEVTVNIIDMRQGGEASPVEVQEERGLDGSRQIQVLVRDEVRRQLRSGELDKDMRSNFGVTRQIARR